MKLKTYLSLLGFNKEKVNEILKEESFDESFEKSTQVSISNLNAIDTSLEKAIGVEFLIRKEKLKEVILDKELSLELKEHRVIIIELMRELFDNFTVETTVHEEKKDCIERFEEFYQENKTPILSGLSLLGIGLIIKVTRD